MTSEPGSESEKSWSKSNNATINALLFLISANAVAFNVKVTVSLAGWSVVCEA